MACSHPTMWVSSKPSLSDTTSLCFLSSLNPFHPPSSLAANNPSRSSSATPIHCGLVELRSRIDSFFITSMNSFTDDIDIPSTKVRPVKKVALVVTGDRGLCAVRFIEGTGLPTAKEAQAIANNVFSLFVSEDVDIVELLYTKFVTSEDELFRLTTKDGKWTVGRASELAARMSAMSNATDKCISIEENLSIIFNRQRQAKITGEILEIVAGVNMPCLNDVSPLHNSSSL
ncbi:hypothetical protein DKX38_016768 [Salix brachista]|uniref:F-ATPase gamma subunit n=1 Tax=Salix brachista TaxID=2182728 RepID=A0A5N5KTQ9_9ROSI|nr:hypothetical protein DKX38_016764 [Salix brachista]KAB5533682.1 hypothetical protein DKX38_016768 [Salix brachista]